MIAFLAVQALVFALWAWLAVRALLRLWRHVARQTGNAMPDLSDTRLALREFLSRPAFAPERRQLGLMTLILLGLSALGPLILSTDR